jgi:two-component system CheB/CheR fusion protein
VTKAPGAKEPSRDRVVARLQQDLIATKEYLHSVVEEQESTNEELQAANEEILSSNEELQSTNEELETAKEELQSTNEEINTVNDELHTRNSELSEVNNDLVNLLNSAQIPTIMLSRDLRIRRFTALTEKVLNLIPSDVGRPLSDLRPNLEVPELERLILEVMDTLAPKEFDVQDRDGHWYSLRIRPYKTLDNRIEGVVIALVDIDELKRSLEQAREASEYAAAIVDTARAPLVVLDSALRVQTANQAFYLTFKVKPEETEQQFIYDLGRGQWNIPRLRELLEEILPRQKRLEDFEVDTEFPGVGRKRILLNARCVARDAKKTQLILLGMEEVAL